jgi:hypothetical protein
MKLNNDILIIIFSYLNLKDKIIILKLSKKMNNLINKTQILWKTIDFSETPNIQTNDINNLFIQYNPERRFDKLVFKNCTNIYDLSFNSLNIHDVKELDIRNTHISNYKTIQFNSLKKIKLTDKIHDPIHQYFEKNNSTITIKKSKTKLQYIFIKTLTNTCIHLFYTNPNIFFSEIKKKVGILLGYSSDEQSYIFAGKRIEDQRTLIDYNIQKESTIHLVLRLARKKVVYSDEIVDFNFLNPKYIDIKEKYSNIYTFNLINPDICDDSFKKKKLEFSDNQKNYINNYIEENLLSKIYKLYNINRKLKITEIFFVHYSLDHEKNFHLHIDQNEITIDICLVSTNVISNHLFFLKDDVNYKINEDDQKIIDNFVKNDFEKGYKPVTGEGIIFKGSKPHKVTDILSGERISLIISLN